MSGLRTAVLLALALAWVPVGVALQLAYDEWSDPWADWPTPAPRTPGTLVQEVPPVDVMLPAGPTRPAPTPDPAFAAVVMQLPNIVVWEHYTPPPAPTRVQSSSHIVQRAGPIAGYVTHYGLAYQGRTMGCPGAGAYDTDDPTIIAVAWPSRSASWPCGTVLRVTGPAGSIVGVRKDSCPGCGPNHLDLSEAGILAVCGHLGRCNVTIEEVR